MQTAVVVQGRLINPTTVELDEPVATATGNKVEVALRLVTPESAEIESPTPLRSLYGLWLIVFTDQDLPLYRLITVYDASEKWGEEY